MTTTAEHIAAIRKALEAGPTPGEWGTEQDRERPQIHRVMGESTVVEGLDGICEPDRMNDRTFEESRMNMAFIASCNPVAMTAVLAEIDRLKAENERMRQALEPFSKYAGPIFERNFNVGDVVSSIIASDGGEAMLLAGDFFIARAALKGETHDN